MALFRCSSGGGGVKVAKGTYTLPSGTGVSEEIYCGFKPKKIFLYSNGSSGNATTAASGASRIAYDYDLYQNNQMRAIKSGSTPYVDCPDVVGGGVNCINVITNNGFKMQYTNMGGHTWYWVALSE